MLAETERDLKRSGLNRKTLLALTPIRPTRERYDRAAVELFAAADQHRRDGTSRSQRREDAAWAKTDQLGDDLDQLSHFLARAIASRGRALQASIDARNQWIIAVVTSLALLVGVLGSGDPDRVGRAKIIAEANRVRAEELLEENQSILDGAGEGILGVDSEGVITFVNPAGSRMTGYEVDELIGHSKREMIHHSRPDRTPYPAQGSPIAVSLREGTVQQADHEVYWRKDGSSFPVEYTITPIMEGGGVRGAVVVFKDITERREMERAKDEFTSVFERRGIDTALADNEPRPSSAAS